MAPVGLLIIFVLLVYGFCKGLGVFFRWLGRGIDKSYAKANPLRYKRRPARQRRPVVPAEPEVWGPESLSDLQGNWLSSITNLKPRQNVGQRFDQIRNIK